MKTERVTFLTTPDFKQYLAATAANDGISIGELIRSRCMPMAQTGMSEEERELAALTAELRRSLPEARKSLQEGLKAAAEALASLDREATRRDRKSSLRRQAA